MGLISCGIKLISWSTSEARQGRITISKKIIPLFKICTEFDFYLWNNIFTYGNMLERAGDFSAIEYMHTMYDHKHYKKGGGKVGEKTRKWDREGRRKLEST